MKHIFLLVIVTSIVACQAGVSLVFAEEQNELSLGIDEISRLALEKNFDIQIYRLDKSISEKDLLIAQSVYDTDLDFSYKYDEDRLARASTLFGNRTSTISQDAALSKTLPTGTVLSLGFSHDREASDSPFSTVNPVHESSTSLSITQPIGENAFGLLDRNTIKITRLGIEDAEYTSLDKIEAELASVQKAYWKLLLANKELELTEEITDSANNLYLSHRKNYELGLIEVPELYATEANLKAKQQKIILAKDILNSAMNLIRLKLNIDKEKAVVPKDDFTTEALQNSFEDILALALNNRRDYQIARNMIKEMDLSLEMKKNSLWPQIDLKASFKKNGIDSRFEDSIREISSGDFPEYTAEVVFSIPLENSAARAERSQYQLKRAQALVSLKKTECLIFVQIHDAFVHAQSMLDSVVLLKEAMELEHNKYLGEEDRFKKGRSDTDRLIRYQDDYLRAKLVYLTSLYNYKAAIVDLKLATNALLKEVEEIS